MKRIELEKLQSQHRTLQKDYRILYQDYVNACRLNRKLTEELAAFKRLRMGKSQHLRVKGNKEN